MTLTTSEAKGAGSIKSAFGAANRARLIDKYFSERGDGSATAEEAWAHVYRLLLWVDQTTGLGHCYESDKSQPGKRWYSRSLAFHDWVSGALATSPGDVAKQIDWLFLRAAEDLAGAVLKKAAKIAAKADEQRKPYAGRGFPKPGEDPELVAIVKAALGEYLHSEPPAEIWNLLVERVRQYLTLENKRKNLVGEGFEDVVAQVIQRTCRRNDLKVFTRRALHELPGFNRARAGDKPNKVDVAIISPTRRILVTAKWSVRADREKQFVTDFADYVNAESDRKPFEYVFITNEFDPARLVRACDQLVGNALMFSHVVHISTEAIKATYAQATERDDLFRGLSEQKDGSRAGNDKASRERQVEDSSMQRVLQQIERGRLVDLEQWLKSLTTD